MAYTSALLVEIPLFDSTIHSYAQCYPQFVDKSAEKWINQGVKIAISGKFVFF